MEKAEDERIRSLWEAKLGQAKDQFFMQDERVRNLNSALLYSDVLAERKNQQLL